MFVFLLFLLFYEWLWEGAEQQRGCQNSGIGTKPSPTEVCMHVKWLDCVEKRTRGIAKAVLLDCFFARVRISVSLFVENMPCFLV